MTRRRNRGHVGHHRIPKCDYCDRPAELVGAEAIYPGRMYLLGKQFWRCAPCEAWVGCHPGTTVPLGRLANAELRRAKQRVHDLFDPLWRSRSKKARNEAYRMLAEKMGIAVQNCHIGMFDLEACRAAEAAIKEMRG